ncbi:MAG: OB-fold domain-containing protein, partial [Chloroflexota bacterium]|nr:OB-fold domain-containing protein [Chloroflexota bacterium]
MASEFTSSAFYNKLKEEKKLVGVKCQDCGHLSPEPRPMCPECHGFDMEWHPFSGKAKLSTFTCISIVPVSMAAKGYGRDKPYCTGIVALEEGPRISAMINGVDGT